MKSLEGVHALPAAKAPYFACVVRTAADDQGLDDHSLNTDRCIHSEAVYLFLMSLEGVHALPVAKAPYFACVVRTAADDQGLEDHSLNTGRCIHSETVNFTFLSLKGVNDFTNSPVENNYTSIAKSYRK